MRWKDLRLKWKLGIGFGVVLACLVGVGGGSILGIGGIVDNAKEVIDGNRIDAMLAQREVDHLNWAASVNALLTDSSVTELHAQTDDKKCAFGQWLHGDERAQAEATVPAIAPLLKEIEPYHVALHHSAIEVADRFSQADPHLPGKISARIVDHVNWAAAIRDCFLQNQESLNVETNPTHCTLGKWINSDEGARVYARGSADFKAAWDEMVTAHRLLHESAGEIQAQYAQSNEGLKELLLEREVDHLKWAQKVSEAIVAGHADLDVETSHTKCAYGTFLNSPEFASIVAKAPQFGEILEKSKAPHEQMHASAVAISAALARGAEGQAEAEQLFVTKTMPALAELAGCFHLASAKEEELQVAQAAARDIFDNKTMPLLRKTLGHMHDLEHEAQVELAGMMEAGDIYAEKTVPNLEKVRGLLSGVRDKVRENVMTDEQMLAAASNTRSTVLTMSAIAIALGAVLAWIIARGIIGPLRKGVAFAQTVAGGDLTQQVDMDQKDEIGMLAKAMNGMADSLRATMKDLAAKAQTLAGSSTELSATATQLASGAEETTNQSASVSAASEEMATNMDTVAASTEEMSANIKTVASAVEEMTASVQEIARNAEQAAQVAGQASSLANTSNDNIGQLGEAADAIGKVIDTIQDIAEQTNLLALNATIEAARAGDAGKGFAVVASEVKDLAKQTAEATEDIRRRIESIQTSTGSAVASIGEISEVITKVNEVSRTIASAVEEQSITTREISGNVTQTASAAETVSTGVTQSASATREITVNITGVDQAARQAAQGAAQTQTAGAELSRLSEDLNSLVAQFKV